MTSHNNNASEDMETFKRRHARQNFELTRANTLHALQLRKCEIEINRLIVENLDLRAQVAQANEQMRKWGMNNQRRYREELEKIYSKSNDLQALSESILRIAESMNMMSFSAINALGGSATDPATSNTVGGNLESIPPYMMPSKFKRRSNPHVEGIPDIIGFNTSPNKLKTSRTHQNSTYTCKSGNLDTIIEYNEDNTDSERSLQSNRARLVAKLLEPTPTPSRVAKLQVKPERTKSAKKKVSSVSRMPADDIASGSALENINPFDNGSDHKQPEVSSRSSMEDNFEVKSLAGKENVERGRKSMDGGETLQTNEEALTVRARRTSNMTNYALPSIRSKLRQGDPFTSNFGMNWSNQITGTKKSENEELTKISGTTRRVSAENLMSPSTRVNKIKKQPSTTSAVSSRVPFTDVSNVQTISRAKSRI